MEIPANQRAVMGILYPMLDKISYLSPCGLDVEVQSRLSCILASIFLKNMTIFRYNKIP